MASIQILEPHIANLIAAGEVVDRPGSAIKELVENSIDAGATSIVVEIKNGGISFIRVTDNGVGISYKDVPKAIKRHATSKIKTEKDLDKINTLGFRGEALASISAVSKFRIMTKRATDKMGTLLECHGADIIDYMETGCQNGTTVILEELFYNIPARRKFLRTDAAEAMYVTSVMERLCISRPDIKFKYIIEGMIKFTTPGSGKLMDAIYAIYGSEFTKQLIPVNNFEDMHKVSGYIGTPQNTRGNSNLQLFFVNGRFIKSKTAYAAIRQAFDSFIPEHRFPTCIINIDIDPTRVDCNVHPTKLEVKFSNEKLVFDLIYFAARSALVKKIPLPQTFNEQQNQKIINAFVPLVTEEKQLIKQSQITMTEMRLTPDNSVEQKEEIPLNLLSPTESFRSKYVNLMSPSYAKANKTQNPLNDTKDDGDEWNDTPIKKSIKRNYEVPYYRILGEAFKSFVIVELDDKLIFIDKHAAHERILFEEMKENMELAETSSQLILIPIEVNVDAESYAAISQFATQIRDMGLDIDLNDENSTVTVKYVPTVLKDEDIPAFIQSLGAQLAEFQTTVGVSKKLLYERALYQASCKAAIKAGRDYDAEHIKWICDRVLALPFIKFCPHGRPVAYEFSKYELEKKFKRI